MLPPSIMSSNHAPIHDVTFQTPQHQQASLKGRKWQSRRRIEADINSDDAQSVSSDFSSGSGRRRFFPSHLFRSSSSGSKKESGSPSVRVKSSVILDEPNCDEAVVVRSMRVWDVKMPPLKKHMVSGHMVPTMRGAARMFIQKNRRLCIEVHGPPIYSLDTMGGPCTSIQRRRFF